MDGLERSLRLLPCQRDERTDRPSPFSSFLLLSPHFNPHYTTLSTSTTALRSTSSVSKPSSLAVVVCSFFLLQIPDEARKRNCDDRVEERNDRARNYHLLVVSLCAVLVRREVTGGWGGEVEEVREGKEVKGRDEEAARARARRVKGARVWEGCLLLWRHRSGARIVGVLGRAGWKDGRRRESFDHPSILVDLSSFFPSFLAFPSFFASPFRTNLPYCASPPYSHYPSDLRRFPPRLLQPLRSPSNPSSS